MVNPEDLLRCSFCNNDQNDVRKLMAGEAREGRRVFICDECVEVCNKIIADDNRFENRSTSSLPPVQRALCGAFLPQDDLLHIPDRKSVCVPCTAAFETAIAEERRRRNSMSGLGRPG